ncbi:MAG: tRNA lysidine(34) synthetase TilS [Tannerellaceae bacterium]
MINTVRTYINKQQLLTTDRPVLVGLSGGADSVALLTLLTQLGYTCIAVHCNFHLRGEESLRDEQFAHNYAESLNVPFYKTDFDTTHYATEKHISIEMAARELRYDWFETMRQKLNAEAIAIAHHRDDSMETLLMNLIRGTGIRGMTGIRPRNGHIIRPLLCVSREEIVRWLAEEGLSFVTDSTNLTDAYTRNFIRLRVVPLLEEINPAIKDTIARTAEHLSAAELIYLHTIEKARNVVFTDPYHLSIPALMQFPAPDTILYELLKPFAFTSVVVREIYQALMKESGKTFHSTTHRLIKDRTQLILALQQTAAPRTYTLTTKEGEWNEPIKLSSRLIVIDKDFRIEKDKSNACFDYDKLTFPLTLRTWQEGDWFIPFGMKGRKKLSDYFTDRKFSRIKKEQIWLLCSDGNIIWIVGERPDSRFCIDETTKHVLCVKKNS